MNTVMVAIAGGSGAGKSWVAGQLRRVGGEDVARIAMDNFYLDRSHLSPGRRSRCNFDHPQAIDWALFRHVLQQAARGKPLELPIYDFTSHARSSDVRQWKPARMVIVEGLWPWQRRELRDLYHHRLFLDAAPSWRLQRRLQRDVRQRGRSAASVQRQFRQQVGPMHDRFVQPQARRAHQVLPAPVSGTDMEALWEHLQQL